MFHTETDVSFGARGLARGLVFDRSGVLVASIQQEALIRPVRRKEAEAGAEVTAGGGGPPSKL